MAREKKIYRYTAGGSGSSTQASDVEVTKESVGFVLRGANYLLERLPFTKNDYEHWAKIKRIVVGYLLWIVVLPVWPLVVAGVLMFNGKVARKGITYGLLALVSLFWFWALVGLVTNILR